eukprot:Protomagalhaensia_wolfi_Nauph_80__2682@NODE_280_length_2939_cov_43_973793_g210_i0_p1_GENE_NODE_280_length_2939_cov_43_973793_g210_i0NODE_280_length_2939_cov_43_973793_g210_i0_p1_ORF_typecomplete_len297_score45_42Steroid_dh/PF02544_16/2_4e03Steroid_dh/PF02544_16/3_6e38ubiquitin/PF00240_23/3_1e05Ubiquitin_2/PF14560_6/0_0014Ubiquitin_4/PF18036_1/0_41Ubiquitin_4/PF18036_1/9_1e03DUF1295/PF06966_12/0_063SfLAP/PF11139_8/1_7e03SfLAP/PF11139_8/0_11_NODE_280_length_2939_cov_43_973793_g210_i08831773
MRVHVHKRSGKFLTTIDIHDSATLDEFKAEFEKQFHYYPERQRFTLKDPKDQGADKAVKDGKLADSGVENESTLYFKDLGVQISWRLVFVLEYLGPLIIFPVLYAMPHLVYGEPVQHSLTQKLAFFLVVAHYLKREFESFFVHRFSNATMPFIRLPINCGHYWVLGGILIAYYVLHPRHQAPFTGTLMPLFLAGVMIGAEVMNCQTHIILRNLRPRGSKTRGVPKGAGFDLCSCANYTWESLAWISFALLVNTLTTWIFVCAAIGQMASWAQKKHKRYRVDPDYPKNRSAIFPYIL